MAVTHLLPGGDKEMRKTIIVGIIAFALLMTSGIAMATTEYTSTVTISGNNIDWSIHTAYDGLHDSFEGAVDSGAVEQVFTDHRQEWNNFKDIERTLDWNDNGAFFVSANFENPEQWYAADVDTWVDGESNDGGSFWQRKLPTGHSEPQYKYPDKRGIELGLFGDYSLGYGAYDMRGDDSGTFDFAFEFSATGDVGGLLNVEEGNIGSEHGGGQWHTEDRYSTDYDFSWGGTLNQNTNVFGYNSVDFSQTEDFTNKFMFGHALVQ